MNQTQGALVSVWGAVDASDASLQVFATRASALVGGATRRLGALEAGFLAQYVGRALGRPRAVIGAPGALTASSATRGVPDEVLWSRPAHTVWTALQEGHPVDVALQRGLGRATELADTNMQLARTHAARHVLARTKGVRTYQRRPSGRGCALCHAAARRAYQTDELMPVHPHCRCTIVPSFSDHPPPLVETDQPTDVLAVHEHGEIGPLLAWAGQDFTGPAAVKETIA
jgi:hypothetical protein